MKTYNTVYSSYENLFDFVNENNIHGDNILIQVFCGSQDKSFISKVRFDILSVLPNATIIGATTRGEIFEGKSIPNSCVISISSFNHTRFTSFIVKQGNLTSFQLGKLIVEELYIPNTKVILVFASSKSFDGEKFLKGTALLPKNIVISGGICDRNIIENKTYVFNETEIIEDGITCVSLSSEELYVNTDFNFGWIPIGKEHTVTECTGNILKSVDNIPAVEFYKKYMLNEEMHNLRILLNQFPFMVKINNYYVCKNIIEVLDNKCMRLNYDIQNGQKVRFGYGNINHILDLARETCNRISTYPVESLFVYSCISRPRFLKDLIDKEILPLNKDISVSGFFTVGEFGRIDGENRFSSQTMTILTLSEEKNARISIDENEFLKEEKIDRLHNKILYNLINTSSNELEDINNELKIIVVEKTEAIKNQYYTDSLTDLPNRLKLINDISSSTHLKLALIDINSFNEINNFYGNKIGDILLLSFCKKIKNFGDNNNFRVYRVNSDVFAIFTDTNITDELFIKSITDLHILIKYEVFKCSTQKLYINTSIGISINQDNLFEKAGMALNYSKLHNKEIQVYDENLSIVKEYENNLQWIKKLNEAISDDRIVPYFQPIYNNKTFKFEKYEALIRMIDENGQVISPFLFLNIARKAHIYPTLTRIMIYKTFDKFKDTDFQFSINLLVEDIQNYKTTELIYNNLKDKNIAKNVVFEIVESEGIENFDEVMEFINTVHSYGCKVAIDDFGTGYSNFTYLIKLNIDYIKIDGSIIQNICTDKTSELVAETIVSFASKLGSEVIAEFVSDKAIYNKISDMGITFSQGYYFSEPKPDI